MPWTKLRFLAILFPVAVYSTGCLELGQTVDLAGVLLTLAASGAGSIAVAALDKREWIRKGAKPPFCIGTQREGFGIPIDVMVKGNIPLAQVVTDLVSNGLKAKGFGAQAVAVDPKADDMVARAALRKSGAEKLILIEIEKWNTDTAVNVAMHYLITAKVFDTAGKLLAETSVTGADGGKDTIRGFVTDMGVTTKKVLPKAFRDQLERLLNADAIVKALS
jgi:hypothetical protein